MFRKNLIRFLSLSAFAMPAFAADQAPAAKSLLVEFPDSSKIHDQPLEVQVPKGLPPLTPNAVVPAYNPITAAKVELGKQLYFDPRVSSNGTVSCATCHNPAKGWAVPPLSNNFVRSNVIWCKDIVSMLSAALFGLVLVLLYLKVTLKRTGMY